MKLLLFALMLLVSIPALAQKKSVQNKMHKAIDSFAVLTQQYADHYTALINLPPSKEERKHLRALYSISKKAEKQIKIIEKLRPTYDNSRTNYIFGKPKEDISLNL